MTAVLVQEHLHTWRIAEIEYSDGSAVRRYECDCGATDYVLA